MEHMLLLGTQNYYCRTDFMQQATKGLAAEYGPFWHPGKLSLSATWSNRHVSSSSYLTTIINIQLCLQATSTN